ncbi:MAG: hypothetical protein JEY94_00985 [Melioribacteraceae bacterium]|nr:hypothetical protein [Melioribacteraceae bacterium]
MSKTKVFWLVFIITTIISFIIGSSMVRESFLSAVGRDLSYSQSKSLWDGNSGGIQFLIFGGSIVIGLILGGITSALKSKSQN